MAASETWRRSVGTAIGGVACSRWKKKKVDDEGRRECATRPIRVDAVVSTHRPFPAGGPRDLS